jgi:tetratricopeptide (TPR) repeat protein
MAEDKNKLNEEVEVIEGSEVEAVSASEQFIEKNMKQLSAIVLAVLVAVVGGIYLYSSSGSAELEDQKKIFRAEYYFGLDSTNLALFGDTSGLINDELVGFDDLTNELESSKIKNLNNYYVGLINLKNGEYEQAVSYLSDFDSEDELLLARGKSLLGDAYMELAETEASNYDNAVVAYKKATELEKNASFTPVYLLKLALAYELKGDDKAAIATYTTLIGDYKSTVAEVVDAKKYKAILEAKAKS